MDFAYGLVLEEVRTHFFEVTCLEIPEFQMDVAGSYIDEAVHRAYDLFNRWRIAKADKGEFIPPPSNRGVTIFAYGMRKNENEVYWSKNDLKRVLGISRSTIDRRIKDGTLKRIRVGRRTLFKPSEVRAALERKITYVQY